MTSSSGWAVRSKAVRSSCLGRNGSTTWSNDVIDRLLCSDIAMPKANRSTESQTLMPRQWLPRTLYPALSPRPQGLGSNSLLSVNTRQVDRADRSRGSKISGRGPDCSPFTTVESVPNQLALSLLCSQLSVSDISLIVVNGALLGARPSSKDCIIAFCGM